MSLPNNALDTVSVPAEFLSPDSDGRQNNRKVDYERGGIALNDSSAGLDVQDWRVRLVGNDVLIGAFPYTTETVLLTDTGISEISLSFDQNMRPALAYVASGQAKLYWYDTLAAAQVTTNLAADVRGPFLSLDDRRQVATTIASNDILLFYIRDSKLCYRQQRERFDTERILRTFSGPGVTIVRCGMNEGLRMQMEIVGINAS